MTGPGSKLPGYRSRSEQRDENVPVPFSLRLTFEERGSLEQAAGDMPLGAYIRSQVFRDKKARRRRRYKRPVKDHQVLGQLLGEVGQARLANNLNQLGKAANTGSLPVDATAESSASWPNAGH
jgi:hypothetical protein